MFVLRNILLPSDRTPVISQCTADLLQEDSVDGDSIFLRTNTIALDGSKRVIDTNKKSASYKLRIFFIHL